MLCYRSLNKASFRLQKYVCLMLDDNVDTCLDIKSYPSHHFLVIFALTAKRLPRSITMSSPRPKEKLSQKLSRLLKPRKRVAGASATSSHSTPLSSSPSQTRSATDDAGHVMDTSRTIAPDASGKHIGSTTIQPLCP